MLAIFLTGANGGTYDALTQVELCGLHMPACGCFGWARVFLYLYMQGWPGNRIDIVDRYCRISTGSVIGRVDLHSLDLVPAEWDGVYISQVLVADRKCLTSSLNLPLLETRQGVFSLGRENEFSIN